MKLSKAMSALPFAHLLGISAAKAEEDEKPKQKKDESDEDFAKRCDEDDEAEDDDKEKKAVKSEEDEEDDKKDEKAKKAKRAEKDDVEDEDEKDDKKEAKAAATAERVRCAAIFGCAAAGIRPDVAAQLAFRTDMTAKAAVAMLETVAAGSAARSNASRSASNPRLGSGGSLPAGAQGIAASWDAALAKANPSRS